MKKILLILTLGLLSAFAAKAQEADDNNEKIRDKMREFIQKRLNLSKNEADRFAPVFIRYFNEWRHAVRENKGDVLLRRQKVVDLQIRYRTEFKEIVGEKRCNRVYAEQDRFIEIIRRQALDRRDNKPIRNRSLLIE